MEVRRSATGEGGSRMEGIEAEEETLEMDAVDWAEEGRSVGGGAREDEGIGGSEGSRVGSTAAGFAIFFA